MRSPPVTRHTSHRAQRGFALLITITLLAFLVILLIGLATYTRVETAIAGNTQRQVQARENALLALNLAVAHLQKYAGPDQRVTATAASFGGINGTRYYTGVWDSTGTGAAPMTWLVSGNELVATDGTPANPLAVTPATPGSSTVQLVGAQSLGTASATDTVSAPLQSITAPGVPGTLPTSTTQATIGRYAWWIGDQGVKAPVALGDPTTTAANFDYSPYKDFPDLLARTRQQISLGAGAADATGAPVFEPRDSNNASLVANQKVTAASQIAFLKNSAGTQLGLTRVQQNFHAWSPNNFSVLANTKLGGLRQDLSLKPDLLGNGFASWANYDPANGGYMEDPKNPSNPVPLPTFTADPLRRRYTMQPATVTDGAVTSVAPVLSYFLLSFNIRTQGGSSAVRPLEARARWMFTLWNPYTSALVPENLRMEISGLPNLRVDNDTLGGVTAAFGLENIYGSPMNISLPWDSTTTANDDRQSWLPGRVYTWTALENTSNTGSAPSGGYASKFYSRNINSDAGQGVQQPASAATVDGDNLNHLDGDARTLTITLYAVRAGGDVKLATYSSPAYNAFTTTPQKFSAGTYQFSYVFRLAESFDTPASPELWLTTAGRDFRSVTLPSEAFVAVPNGTSPEQYPNFTTISAADRLLDRATNGLSYDEDTPVFELPRAPLLSVGQLQHLALPGQRPFAIGNSWIGNSQLNTINASELFDRYFFSGLVPTAAPVTVNASLMLPNPTLKVGRDPATGVSATLADLQGAPNAASSKFLLQGAAFNLNSTNATAWAAVLRSVRFAAPQSFKFLNANFSTGTADDDTTDTVQSTDAQFARFSQSAQETYKNEAGFAASTVAPPGPADVASLANTHLFRKGLRSLTAADVAALAQKIADAIKLRQATSGPFRSLEEFLAPASPGNPSLLEQAIVDANINSSIAEFSSQWLTQGDIMTALAPVLFPRSDTFVIRTYGEAVNPITSATEGKAWCEAIVQRVPEYFDATTATGDDATVAPAALTSTLNQTYGRRFKVVSFRWLTRSDI